MQSTTTCVQPSEMACRKGTASKTAPSTSRRPLRGNRAWPEHNSLRSMTQHGMESFNSGVLSVDAVIGARVEGALQGCKGMIEGCLPVCQRLPRDHRDVSAGFQAHGQVLLVREVLQHRAWRSPRVPTPSFVPVTYMVCH